MVCSSCQPLKSGFEAGSLGSEGCLCSLTRRGTGFPSASGFTPSEWGCRCLPLSLAEATWVNVGVHGMAMWYKAPTVCIGCAW